MSSIIRRIFTQAIDMWTAGLREACGQTADVFYDELRLPTDESDWEDPADGYSDSAGTGASLEDQLSGITLQDNEKLPAFHDAPSEALPPPLPPRSRAPSAKSSADSVQRKPAPALAVPPRYSTVISDAPEDMAESPITYAATTDGFAPRRNNDSSIGQAPPVPSDKKKSGTSSQVPVLPPISASARYHAQEDPFCPISTFASKINIPKRKGLTLTQIDNVEKAIVASEVHKSREVSPIGLQDGMALPGLTGDYNSNTRAKRSPSTTYAVTSPQSEVSAPETAFRRPSIP